MFDRQSSIPAPEADLTSAGAPFGADQMSSPQLRTLLSLASEGPQTVKRLADGLHLHESAIEGLCAVLVTRGLVVRVPNDSGAIVVALSTGGHRRIDDVIYHRALAAERLPVTSIVPTTP